MKIFSKIMYVYHDDGEYKLGYHLRFAFFGSTLVHFMTISLNREFTIRN